MPVSDSKRFVYKRDNSKWGRSRRRLFHRLISGVKKARLAHRQVWFVTLTTSDEFLDVLHSLGSSVRDAFKRDFSRFVKRARREFGSFEYIAVHTDEGNGVYHLLVNSVSIGSNYSFGGFKGFKAFWYWLSENWLDVHFSSVVWSVLLKGVKKGVNYIMGHYLTGQKTLLRYHFSWDWVFKGFSRSWKVLCVRLSYTFGKILPAWHKLIFDRIVGAKTFQVVFDG